MSEEELAALAHQFRGSGSDKSRYTRQHDGIKNELGFLTPREQAQLKKYMDSRSTLQSLYEAMPNLLGGSGAAGLPGKSRLKDMYRDGMFFRDGDYSSWLKNLESQGYKNGGSTFSGNAFYQGGGAFIPEYDMAFPADYAVEMMRQGGIFIDPAKKGTFKAQATRMGMGVQEAASAILSAPKEKYSPAMRKKANFAKNFGNRKQMGGPVEGEVLDVTPEQLDLLRQQGYEFEIM